MVPLGVLTCVGLSLWVRQGLVVFRGLFTFHIDTGINLCGIK